MGLFQGKQQPHTASPRDEMTEAIEHLFDDEFREELRNRSRAYFERVISENATLFRQDLDATVAHINTELRQYVTRQLDIQFTEIAKANADLQKHMEKRLNEQLAEYGKTIKAAQELALQAVERSAQTLERQHQQLGIAIEKSVAKQDALIVGAFEQNMARITAMKATQDQAMQTLTRSIQALEQQHQQLGVLLQKGVADQEGLMIDTFEQNMARIVEHYVQGALGDQFDMKAQLPAIIKQMEANKQAIVDDMKL